ncbi:hypothetical protein ES702_03306 [subsurface metagenome]
MGLKCLIEWAEKWWMQRNIEEFKKIKPHLDRIAEADRKANEEKRIFTFQGRKHRLTLTELRNRLDGTPTKHVLAVWENGEGVT